MFIIVMMTTLLVSRRDLASAALLLGQLLNEVLNYLLKNTIKAPRPSELHQFAPKFGMPSNHGQFMGFFAAYILFWAIKHWRTHALQKWFFVLGTQGLAAAVCVSRVYLLYHSWSQVAVGYAVGAAAGFAYFIFVEACLRPAFPFIASWTLCRWLRIRDLTLVEDAIDVEYRAALEYQPGLKAGGARGFSATRHISSLDGPAAYYPSEKHE